MKPPPRLQMLYPPEGSLTHANYYEVPFASVIAALYPISNT